MTWLFGHAFVVALWATVLWATIKLMDRHHPKNTFGRAVALGVLFDLTNFTTLSPLIYLAAWLLIMMQILIWSYHLNLLGAAIATAATIFGPYYFVTRVMLKVLETNVELAEAMFYALPIIVFTTWFGARWLERRNQPRDEAPAKSDGPLPVARIARFAKSLRKKPVAPAAAVAPVARVAPKPVAPPSVPQTPPGEGPSILT